MSPCKPYFVSPNLFFQNRPSSSSNLSLTQISHSLALSRFFFRAIAISKFLKANLSASVWLQSRSFSKRLRFRFRFRSSILSTAVDNLRKTNRILQNLLQLRDLSQNDISTISILISKLSPSLDFEDQGIAYAEITTLREGRKVHNSESDIDALCVGPCFATLAEDFFVVLHNMLTSKLEVSEVHCVKDAKVPLMRFKLDGISIDLPYAQLKVMSVTELSVMHVEPNLSKQSVPTVVSVYTQGSHNVDILNPFFLSNIDETSWRSLSGVHANECILRLLPNMEDILRLDFGWACLFEPFPYTKKYTRFVKICLAASDQD